MTSLPQPKTTTAQPSTSPPPPLGADLHTRLAIAHSRVEFGDPVEERTKRDLRQRLAVLNASFADRRPVLKNLRLMIAGMSVGRMSMDEAASLAALYASAVEGKPSWAVIQACERCTRRAGPSGSFLPNVPEFVGVVDDEIGGLAEERAKISRVLDAKPKRERAEPSPEERARVADKLEKLSESVGRVAAEAEAEFKKNRQKPMPEWLEEFHAKKEQG